MDAAPGDPRPPTVSVIVTVLNDPRVARTVESLLAQSTPVTEVIVDDGGGDGRVAAIATELSRRDPRVRHLLAPGNIAESRNAAISRATSEFVAFLDADEVAPPEWLERLLVPFANDRIGFAGGPTPADPATLRNRTARFYNGYLARFYDRVASVRPHALPMGNSVWRTRLFTELGPLKTFGGRRVGNEDHEFAVRALRAGWKGAYVREASVIHDFSDIRLGSLLKKQARYAEGGYLLWRATGSTYETSGGRLGPYVLAPALILAGAILLPFSGLRWLGAAIAGTGAIVLGVVVVVLAIGGRIADTRYPGLRYLPIEVLRRWATLYGALRGALHPIPP